MVQRKRADGCYSHSKFLAYIRTYDHDVDHSGPQSPARKGFQSGNFVQANLM